MPIFATWYTVRLHPVQSCLFISSALLLTRSRGENIGMMIFEEVLQRCSSKMSTQFRPPANSPPIFRRSRHFSSICQLLLAVECYSLLNCNKFIGAGNMLHLAVETYENGVGTGAEKDYLVDPNDESFIWWNVGSKTKHLVLRVYLMHANGSRIALPDGESLPISSSLIFMDDEFVPDQYQSRSGTGSGTKAAPIFQILIEDSILSIIGDQPALIRFRINEVSSSRVLGGSKINPKKFRVLVFVHGRTDITPTRSACIEVKSKTNNVKKSVRPDDEVAGGAVDKKKQKVDLSLNFSLIPAPVQFGSSSSSSSDPSAIRRRMEETIVHTIDIFQNNVMNTMIQR